MHFTSPGTALVLKRASMGPAAMALRAQRMQGRNYLTNPTGNMLVRGGSMGHVDSLGAVGFRYVGLGDTQAAVKGAGASYAGATAGGAASTALVGAGYGAVAGPIGAVVGLVVGLAIGALLKKNYIDVAGMNAHEDAEVATWKQYQQIIGKAAGRHFGLDAMTVVWKGALHSGLFGRNNEKQCFHNGCSKFPGNANLIDVALTQTCGDRNCFADQLPKFMAWKQANPGVGRTIPVIPINRMVMRGAGGRMAGLGALGAFTTPDAVAFVDQFLAPANAPGTPCSGHPCYWLYPTTAAEKQVLYDVADAYLDVKLPGQTTPYIAAAPPPVAVAVAPVASAPASGTIPTGGPTPLSPGYNYGGGGSQDVGGGYTYTPVTNPTTGQTTYQPTPTTKTTGPVTAGVSALPSWSWLLIAAGLAFALARPEHR
jgi:hypothetical protein